MDHKIHGLEEQLSFRLCFVGVHLEFETNHHVAGWTSPSPNRKICGNFPARDVTSVRSHHPEDDQSLKTKTWQYPSQNKSTPLEVSQFALEKTQLPFSKGIFAKRRSCFSIEGFVVAAKSKASKGEYSHKNTGGLDTKHVFSKFSQGEKRYAVKSVNVLPAMEILGIWCLTDASSMF